MISEELKRIQQALKVPKNQYNSFGKYNYRSCEDILEEVKKLLKDSPYILVLFDEMINLGDRYYIKATARLGDGKESVETYGYARESETKKGMDESQITGASSSYARKRALEGLFLLDDTKDADSFKNDSVVVRDELEGGEEALKKARAFYAKREDIKKVSFIDEILSGKNTQHIGRVLNAYMIDSAKGVFSGVSTETKELTKELSDEQQELY